MDPWALSAAELLAAFRARTVSPREAVDAVAERIQQLDPELASFTELCLGRARREADAASGDRPLAGVPFAVKDLIDTRDVRTTYGSRIFSGHVPDADARAVTALRRAGAILVGKTRTHEFAWGITTVHETLGSTLNPWDPGRVAGGSSGGSAAALAARLVPLALGSDTGGSLRIPAAFCGVLGFKPTYERLDARGVWPLAPSLDHVGPMARTPEDVELLLAAMEGRAAEPAEPDVRGTTVVVTTDAVRGAAAALASCGARIVEREIPELEGVEATFRVIQGYEAVRVHRRAGLFPKRASDYGSDVRARLERAAAIGREEYERACAARERLRSELEAALAGGALLLTPVSTVSPPPLDGSHEELRAAVLPHTVPHNLAGIPSCAVRAGFDRNGMPLGVQVAAARGRDRDALRGVAALYAATPDVQARWP